MNWLFFAIFSRGLYAAINVIDKYIIEKHIPPMSFFLIAGCLNLTVLAIIPFREIAVPPTAMLLLLLFAGAPYMYGILFYFQALSLEEASRVVPLWQLTPILTLLIASLTVGEQFDLKDGLAFAILVTGGALISLRRREGVIRISRALWLMILSSFLFALWSIAAKYAYAQVAFIDGYFWLRVGSFLSILPLFLFRGFRYSLVRSASRLRKPIWAVIFANELIALIALASLEYAILLGSVSLTIALQATQPLFLLLYAIVLSLWFPKILKEELRKEVLAIKLVAIVLLATGVFLVSL